MAKGGRRNPQLGAYRVELRDARGRFTSRYSLARVFRIYFEGQPASDYIQFDKGSSARAKEYRVLVETDRDAERAYKAEKAKKKKPAAKKRRPKREPAPVAERVEPEAPREHEEVPEEPESRRLQVVDDEEFARRLQQLRTTADEVVDDDEIGSRLVRYMDASSKGVETYGRKVWDEKTGKRIFHRGSTIRQLEENGMQKRNMIWWIAREYLRRLGHAFFESVAFRYSRSTIAFRPFLVTNLVKHTNPILIPPQGATDVVFRRGLKGAARKEQEDQMTWQFVQAIMKSLYGDGRYHSGSLTSSDAFFQALLPSTKSIGIRSTKTQTFKLGFTLILQLD